MLKEADNIDYVSYNFYIMKEKNGKQAGGKSKIGECRSTGWSRMLNR